MLDIALNYEECGSGENLILLHGNGESHEYFAKQIAYFSKYCHVFAIDTRGHGKSPRGNRALSIAQFADDLFEFMHEHGLITANILGFSDGGNVALTFALRHREMVNKLILNGANLFPSGVKSVYQLPIEIEYFFAKLMRGFSPKINKKYELLSLMVNEPNISAKDLKSLDIPTLVIAGKNDMIKTKHTMLIAESLPASTLKIIDGNHFCAYNNYNEFNNIVKEFLKHED